MPKELGVVGRIINGVYIPSPKKRDEGIDVKCYGRAALYDKVGKGILADLSSKFEHRTAMKIYCIAMLRAMEPGIRNRDLEAEYLCSFTHLIFIKNK